MSEPLPRYATTRACRQAGKDMPQPVEPALPGLWTLLSTNVCHYQWYTQDGHYSSYRTRHDSFEYTWTWERVVDTVTRIGELVEERDKLAEGFKALSERYVAECEIVQEYVQKHTLGNGGENIFELIVEDAERMRALLARVHGPEAFWRAWQGKRAEGYQYGVDALEQVRFGFEIAQALLTEADDG